MTAKKGCKTHFANYQQRLRKPNGRPGMEFFKGNKRVWMEKVSWEILWLERDMDGIGEKKLRKTQRYSDGVA